MTTEARGSILVIEVPPKIWRTKAQNRYTTPYYVINIDDGVFDFDFYSKQFFCPKYIRKNSQWDDLILF